MFTSGDSDGTGPGIQQFAIEHAGLRVEVIMIMPRDVLDDMHEWGENPGLVALGAKATRALYNQVVDEHIRARENRHAGRRPKKKGK